ncbi:WD40/YVTN/BNR-like repeat-containing protein [Leifsonia xyli]|uniref:WD40/YVTN/BNR-like repeat-containing protein n=1 Tax=Leifsonia xyli TaxID=1575 RepID=UPI003D6740E0
MAQLWKQPTSPPTPGKADTIYAATRAGVAISTDGGRTFKTDTNAPILNQLAIAGKGTVYGIGPDGYLWKHAGASWTRGEVLPGTAQALTATDDRVILATDRGIFATADMGVQWTPLWTP